MKTLWLTDIHLECVTEDQRERFMRAVAEIQAGAVVISGDVGQAPTVTAFLRSLQDRVRIPVYFVLGNHDFYHGSIGEVRSAVRSLSNESKNLRWLNASDVVPLTERTSLIGHDGWGDGRLGDYGKSRVQFNDFRLIDELRHLDRDDRLAMLMRLGDEASEHLRTVLPRALARAEHVVVVTHVPPFAEATWHEGRQSGEEWLPYFACKAVGDVLAEAMQQHPDPTMTVLCGHTHGGGESRILPNLIVFTGPAEYGHPAVQEVFEW